MIANLGLDADLSLLDAALNVRRFNTSLRYRPLTDVRWIRRYSMGPEFTYLTNLDNQLQTRDFGFSAFVNLETGDWLGFRLRQRFENLEESFEIHEETEDRYLIDCSHLFDEDLPSLETATITDTVEVDVGIDIPATEHSFTYYSLNFFSDEGRRLSSRGSVELGDFWNGERFRFSVDATVKANSRFSLSADYEFNSVRLPGGDFKTNALSNRFLYTFTTDLFLRGLVQWNSKSEIVGINALCNWRYRPGSDLFLVYSQVWDTDGGGQLNHALQFKLTYFWKR